MYAFARDAYGTPLFVGYVKRQLFFQLFLGLGLAASGTLSMLVSPGLPHLGLVLTCLSHPHRLMFSLPVRLLLALVLLLGPARG